jgi:hypothetical protein
MFLKIVDNVCVHAGDIQHSIEDSHGPVTCSATSRIIGTQLIKVSAPDLVLFYTAIISGMPLSGSTQAECYIEDMKATAVLSLQR